MSLFPAGLDPLKDLLELKRELTTHTEAIIQLQLNQNELIKAMAALQNDNLAHQERINFLLNQNNKLNAEIKKLRNSTTSNSATK